MWSCTPTLLRAPCGAQSTKRNAAAKNSKSITPEHGITPKTIIKKITNTIEITKAASEKVDLKDIPAEIEKLKSLMTVAAKSLDFETAIKMRDRMAELKKIQSKYSGRRGKDII